MWLIATFSPACSLILWKAKIPLKNKIWPWLIWHNAIASKDNTSKHGWVSNTKCEFCNEEEIILHMFFTCAMAKFVWSCVAKSIGAQIALLLFLTIFGGFLIFFLLAEMFKLQGLHLLVGLSGSFVTKPALRAS
jgi:hypothetical protein